MQNTNILDQCFSTFFKTWTVFGPVEIFAGSR